MCKVKWKRLDRKSGIKKTIRSNISRITFNGKFTCIFLENNTKIRIHSEITDYNYNIEQYTEFYEKVDE